MSWWTARAGGMAAFLGATEAPGNAAGALYGLGGEKRLVPNPDAGPLPAGFRLEDEGQTLVVPTADEWTPEQWAYMARWVESLPAGNVTREGIQYLAGRLAAGESPDRATIAARLGSTWVTHYVPPDTEKQVYYLPQGTIDSGPVTPEMIESGEAIPLAPDPVTGAVPLMPGSGSGGTIPVSAPEPEVLLAPGTAFPAPAPAPDTFAAAPSPALFPAAPAPALVPSNGGGEPSFGGDSFGDIDKPPVDPTKALDGLTAGMLAIGGVLLLMLFRRRR